VTCWY